MINETVRKILGSKQYIREKYVHDLHCDDGEVIHISAFAPFNSVVEPCAYCLRIKKQKGKVDGTEKTDI